MPKQRWWGLFLIGIIFALTALSYFYTPYEPSVFQISARLQAPSAEHLFGTDHLGRDVLSRILAGGQVSLFLGIRAVLLGALLGIALGLSAGFWGGLIDELVMRGSDGLQSLPSILLALLFAAVWRGGSAVVLWAVALGNVPIFSRLTRVQVLQAKEEPYVEASRAVGAADWRIALRHILPNVKDALLVQFSASLAGAILVEASLSYLGVGIQPPTPSWGRMLREAQTFAAGAPWLVVVPGLVIALTVVGFNLLGDTWINGR